MLLGLLVSVPFYCWVLLFHCMEIPQSGYHLTVDRLLSCFQFGAITYKAAMNICAQVFMWTHQRRFLIIYMRYTLINNTAYYSAVVLHWTFLYGHKRITALLISRVFYVQQVINELLQILLSYRLYGTWGKRLSLCVFSNCLTQRGHFSKCWINVCGLHCLFLE